jgi:hypothetical protein
MILATAMPLGIGLVSMLIGCNKPQAMVSAPGVPASQGTVKVSKSDNGNTKIEVHVKHLAPPFKVAPNASIYVVWLQPREGAKLNIGALALNDNLEGKLETMTPHRHFQISVTPEAGGHVDAPTHEPVFTASVERKD